MTSPVHTVAPEMDVHALAALLVQKNISGAPVVSQGKVVGVVTESDLIVRDTKVHLPTFVYLLSGVIPIGGKELEDDLKKVTTMNVKGIMQAKFISLTPKTPVEEIASFVVEKNITYFPVIDGDVLVGVVTRRDLVKAIASDKLW